MKYCKIKPNDVANGNGVTVSVWTQGCPHHCKGCFNKETWDFSKGKDFNEETLNKIHLLLDDYGVHRNLSILGGEPLCPQNIDWVIQLCDYIKKHRPSTKIYCWTGYTFEELQNLYDISKLKIDILIDGKFNIDKKDITLKWRGSSNQRVLDMQKSIQSNKAIPL